MYEKFDKFVTKILNNIIVTILIFVIGFSICAAFLYNVLDFKYATDKDYEPLYQIQQTVTNDFDTVYTFSNTVIDITDSNIIVFIYGDDCYLKTYFDKSQNYKSTQKIDTTDPIGFSVFLLIVGTAIGSIIFYLLFAVTLVIICLILRKICSNKNISEKDLDYS